MSGDLNGAAFLAALPEIEDWWREGAARDKYCVAPDDWIIAVTDVIGSTAAVAAGAFAPVNFSAAAGIVAATNACRDVIPDPPAVFTGDGCLVLCPPAAQEPVLAALAEVRAWAAQHCGLRLRAGFVRCGELAAAGAPVLVGRQTRPRSSQWHVRGRGVALADAWIKADERRWIPLTAAEQAAEAAPTPPPEPDLSGLSCRWAPLAARRGVILSVLMRARPELEEADADAVYADILRRIAAVAADHGAFVPDQLRLAARIPDLMNEQRFSRGPRWWRWTRAAGFFLFTRALERFDWRFGRFRMSEHREHVMENLDACQFIDGLALTIDVDAAGADQIERRLALGRAAGLLVYGTHRAEAARMLCYAPNLDRHHHFMDSTVGGYWRASQMMKAQLEGLSGGGG